MPTLNYWYNTDENNQKMAEVLQAGWKDVGINVTLSNFEWATLPRQGRQGREGQVYRMGWVADYPSIDNFIYLFQSTKGGAYGSYTSLQQPAGRRAVR